MNRNIPLSINAPLSERLKYAPDTVDLEDVADTLKRYEALLAVVNDWYFNDSALGAAILHHLAYEGQINNSGL